MNVFIYDSFLNHKKFDKVLARIETRITDLGLNGKINRQSLVKNIKDTIQNELKRGAKTIIAVGNDETINEVISAVANTNIPVGLIPIDFRNNFIADSLGIPYEDASCDILAARRIETLDLGMVNNNYFLINAVINTRGTIIEINKNYSIETLGVGEVQIINLVANKEGLPSNFAFSPTDGILELRIVTRTNKGVFNKKKLSESVFAIKGLTMFNTLGQQLILDGAKKITPPLEVVVCSKSLNIIVGKTRNF